MSFLLIALGLSNQPIFYTINFIGTFFGFYILFKIRNIKNNDIFWIAIGITLNIIGNALTIFMIILDRYNIRNLFTTNYPLLFMRVGILFDILFYLIAILRKWQKQETALILQKIENEMVVQKLRNKIAADLHDEVGSTLNSIGISTKIIQKKIKEFAPELQSILNQMEVDSNETINTIRDTVWALNPENDSVQQLIEKIRIFAMQMFGNKDIELLFDNKINSKNTIKLGIDAQKNLYLIAKEAINNVVKHAEASIVNISFDLVNEKIIFKIKDNGKGFDCLVENEGNGLKNFNKRAKESYMNLQINTKPNDGTEINLEISII